MLFQYGTMVPLVINPTGCIACEYFRSGAGHALAP